MMNYEEFKNYVVEHIMDYLPENCQNREVSINRAVKNNDLVLDGLNIRDPESPVAPVFYLNQSFEEYENGMEMNEIMESIAAGYERSVVPDFNLDVKTLNSYDNVKDSIVCRLINQEANTERLSQAPYTQIEDLAVTYHVQVSQDMDGVASYMISNTMMKEFGVDVETLHNQAMENMLKISPLKFKSLNDIMTDMMIPQFAAEYDVSEDEAKEMVADMMPADGGPQIYCLTNQIGINGAACIVNPEVQEQVAEQFGGDYFILPSSVHECLVIPKSENMTYQELQDMVQEVNGSCVSPDEKLSDHVYEYDAKLHQINRCDKVQSMDRQLAAVQENSHEYSTGTKEMDKEEPQHTAPRH